MKRDGSHRRDPRGDTISLNVKGEENYLHLSKNQQGIRLVDQEYIRVPFATFHPIIFYSIFIAICKLTTREVSKNKMEKL